MTQVEMFDSVEETTVPPTNYDMIVQLVSAKAEVSDLLEQVSMVLMVYNSIDERGSDVFVPSPYLDRDIANELHTSLTFIHGCLSTVISEHLNVQEQESE